MARRRLHTAVRLMSLCLIVAACDAGSAGPTSTTTVDDTTTSLPPTSTTSTVVTTTTTVPDTTTSTVAQGDTVTVLLAPFGEMGPGWAEQVFPYGDTEETLGTAPGGDGLMLGPEYGAQTPDGGWSFMDAAKLRVARYDEDALFTGAVALPPDVLVDGQYFQFQDPIALDDGTVVASGFRGEASSALLTIDGDEVTSTVIDASVPWVTTDGAHLYGFSLADERPRRLDPVTIVVEDVEWFLARDDSRYMIRIEGSDVVVDLPDAGVTKTLQMRFSEDPAVAVRAGIEVETGSDGTVFILFYGAPESDESLGVGGFVAISASGHVGVLEPIVEPFTPADPGSPSHLGVTPGTSDVWVMVVAEDGVHVYLQGG